MNESAELISAPPCSTLTLIKSDRCLAEGQQEELTPTFFQIAVI